MELMTESLLQFLAFSGLGEEAGGSRSVGSAWRPSWGLRAKDSVVGSTRHAKDWSCFGIPPCDYKDIVTATNMDVVESMCAQAIATVFIPFFFFFCLLCLFPVLLTDLLYLRLF